MVAHFSCIYTKPSEVKPIWLNHFQPCFMCAYTQVIEQMELAEVTTENDPLHNTSKLGSFFWQLQVLQSDNDVVTWGIWIQQERKHGNLTKYR